MSTIQNANYGLDRIGGDGGQSIYEESSTPKHRIGEKLELSDGRVFRYGYTAQAINAAELVSQDLSETALVDTNDVVIAASGDFSPAAGSYLFQITLAGKTKDQYAGGYFQVVNDGGDGIGEGIQYRIKSNSATGATTTGKVDIYLYDPIKVTLTTASDIAITGNLWNNLRGAIGTADYVVSGVTPIAFTANYYGWFQTAGVALVASDGTITIGTNLTLSDSDVGHVQIEDAYTEPRIGYSLFESDDDAHVGVLLQGLTV